MKMKSGILGILTIFLFVNIASAGFDLRITPAGSDSTVPGGTIGYIATVSPEIDGLGSPWEDVRFSVEDPMDGWNYAFNPTHFMLYETDTSKSSTLTISVPADTQPGIYSHTVSASGYDESGQIIGIATEFRTEIFDVPVAPVSELGVTVLMSVGLLGVFIVSRKYGKQK